METVLVRLRPCDPRCGHVLRQFTYAGIRIQEESGWHRVSKEVAEYLRTVRQAPTEPNSPLAFDVCIDDEAKAEDTKDESELTPVRAEPIEASEPNSPQDPVAGEIVESSVNGGPLELEDVVVVRGNEAHAGSSAKGRREVAQCCATFGRRFSGPSKFDGTILTGHLRNSILKALGRTPEAREFESWINRHHHGDGRGIAGHVAL